MSLFTEQRPWCLIPRRRDEWLGGGVSARDLVPPLYRRTSRGYFVPTSAGHRDGERLTTQRILDAVPLTPSSGALAGWAAAFVHGVDWLDGRDRRGLARIAVHVGAWTGRSAREVQFIHGELADHETETCHGLAVTGLARTAFDTVRWADDLADAVAALDAILRFTPLTLADFAAEVEQRPGWRGLRQAREAMGLADPHVLSAAESRLRAVYRIEAGLPRPLVNPWVFGPDWRLLGRPDLYDAIVGHAIEYDGSYHDDPAQRIADQRRQRRFDDAGIVMTRVVAADFTSHLTLIDRLRLDRMKASLTHGRSVINVVPAGSTTDVSGRPVPGDVLALIAQGDPAVS